VECHGGGWCAQDRFTEKLRHEAMAQNGIVSIALDFRPGTEAPYPAGNGHYTIFGQVVEGQPLVGKIAHVIRERTASKWPKDLVDRKAEADKRDRCPYP
jgi:cyclophilin family peptidyl-prolyl cis-trans isomerase